MIVEARRYRVRREARLIVPAWPIDERPIGILVSSDKHLGNIVTGRTRMLRLVTGADALGPNLVLMAGDCVIGHKRANAAIAFDLAPRARLRTRFGMVAVLGNPDLWTDAAVVRATLRRANVIVLDDVAVRRGPLAIGGLGDVGVGHAQLERGTAALRQLGGTLLLLACSPNIPSRWRGIVVAGHTHCGQIVLTGWGPPVDVAPPRYRRRMVRDDRRTTIVTARSLRVREPA